MIAFLDSWLFWFVVALIVLAIIAGRRHHS
jgi:hypothetical protein